MATNELITQLTSEHTFIKEKLKEAKKLGMRSHSGLDALVSAKRALMAHLTKEDRELYPSLREAAKTDAEARAMLDMFARDMEAVTAVVLKFFEKYEAPDAAKVPDSEFARDFGELVARLSLRISTEEQLLYKQFERMKLSAAS